VPKHFADDYDYLFSLDIPVVLSDDTRKYQREFVSSKPGVISRYKEVVGPVTTIEGETDIRLAIQDHAVNMKSGRPFMMS
jgi:hypothetical protein